MNKTCTIAYHERSKFFCVARQIKAPTYARVAVLASCQRDGLMRIQMYLRVAERQYSMPVHGLVETLHGKLFYVYIAKFMARPLNIAKFMKVFSARNALACIIHPKDNETQLLKDDGSIFLQSNKSNINQPPGRSEKQVNRHHDFEISNKVLDGKRLKERTAPDEYSRSPEKFIEILTYSKRI